MRRNYFHSGVGVGLIALSTLLASTTYSAAQRHGGAPAAPHISAPHVSAPHFSAAPHVSAAPHFVAPHFNVAPHVAGAPHFRAAPHFNAAPHFAGRLVRPSGRSTGHVGRIAQEDGRSVQRFRSHVPSVASHNVASGHNAPNVRRNVERNTVQERNGAIGVRNERNAPVEHNAVRTGNATTRAVHQALVAPKIRDTLRHPADLRNPRTRSFVTAAAATAGWHGRHEWWRHRHSGFGWVGPLFWPFAYYDVYDYALWGDGYDVSFWDYGYPDIYAAVFAPYDYDELVGYLPDHAGASHYASRDISAGERIRSFAAGEIATMCGDDTRNIAGIPIDQTRQALQLDDQQRTALDALADASVKAAQVIKAACPADIALTAPGRLEIMQQRIEAMIQAVQIVQPPLDKFYSLLSDEQKARLTALGQGQNPATSQASNTSSGNGSLITICGPEQAALTTWPTDEILKAVRPNEQQRAKLDQLKDATTKAAEDLQAACPAQVPLTPSVRLAAVANRLDAMLSAIKTMRTALNDFYGSLSDEQKSQFDAIGPQRTKSG